MNERAMSLYCEHIFCPNGCTMRTGMCEQCVRAALDAAQPKWQPIESAPKDGTYILLLGDSGYTTTPHRIAVGCWIEGYRDYWLTHSNDAFTDDGSPPTHWMPLLPAPPEKEESI